MPKLELTRVMTTGNQRDDYQSQPPPELEINQSQTVGPDALKMHQSIKKRNASFTVEQTIQILGRSEILRLTEVPSHYLLDELNARGTIHLVESGESGEIKIDSLAEGVRYLLARFSNRPNFMSDLYHTVLAEAYKLSNNVQKDAAALLGISKRIFNYQFHNGPSEALGIIKRDCSRKNFSVEKRI